MGFLRHSDVRNAAAVIAFDLYQAGARARHFRPCNLGIVDVTARLFKDA